MRGSRRHEAFTIAALAITTLAAIRSHDLYEKARLRLETVAPSYLRSTIQDRLIGSRLDLDFVPIGESQRPYSLVWIVDLDLCEGCIDSVVEWTVLDRLDGYARYLVLTGSRSGASVVRARRRALASTTIVPATREAVRSAVGQLLPSTKLLLDSTGVVLMADTRTSGQLCGWSFDAQVGALMGVTPVSRIRN
jgi:hypothetical protein